MTDLHADGRQPGRRRGARPADRRHAAAKALGVDRLNEQFSAWAPEKMIEQFKQALAAKPSCIVIMGHPGNDAFADLVKQAVDQGIVVTHGNAPLTDLQKAHGPQGFGYAGVDLYEGGKLTAQDMIKAGGLKSGDKAMVYGVFSQAERGQSEKGLADTLEKAGLKVDRLEITPGGEFATRRSRCRCSRPMSSATRTSRRSARSTAASPSVLADVLKTGRQEARRDHRRRHRSRARDDRRAEVRLRLGHARPAPLSAGLHSGAAMRADGEVQDARHQREHGRRRRNPEDDQLSRLPDRIGDPVAAARCERLAPFPRRENPARRS